MIMMMMMNDNDYNDKLVYIRLCRCILSLVVHSDSVRQS